MKCAREKKKLPSLASHNTSFSWCYTHSVIPIQKLKVRLQTISYANYLCRKLLPTLMIPGEHTWNFFLSFRELTHFQDEKFDLHISMTLTPARVAEAEKKGGIMLSCGVSCANMQQLFKGWKRVGNQISWICNMNMSRMRAKTNHC